MKKPIKILAVSLTLIGAGAALAHTGATGIVKERMDAMKSIGDEMKVLGGMFQGKIEFDAGRIAKASEIIAGHGENIEKLFPKGSDHKPTRALPEVWKDKAEFDAISKEMVMAAMALSVKSKDAKSVGDIKAELIALGSNCKACHKKFRAPEK